MKATTKTAGLGAALKQMRATVERRNTIPILANVLIEARDGKLRFTATDLDIVVSTEIEASVSEAGATTVACDMVSAFVAKIAADEARLEMVDKQLKISAGRSRVSLQTLPVEDFPSQDVKDSNHKFSLDKAAFRTLLGKVEFCISAEETRYYLNGIYLCVVGEKLRAVATDGHKLGTQDIALPDGAAGSPSIIVPRKTIGLALSLFEKAEQIDVIVADGRIAMSAGPTTLQSKLIDGTFPDYNRVIPKENPVHLVASRANLAQMIGRVAVMSGKSSAAATKLSLADGKMTATVRNSDAGEAVEDMDVTFDGVPFEIGFNARYLTSILEEIEGDEVHIAMSDPGSPALFSAEGDSSALFVLMPMRV